MSGSMSGDWKRGPIKDLPRQSSTLRCPGEDPKSKTVPRCTGIARNHYAAKRSRCRTAIYDAEQGIRNLLAPSAT
jgi:hypothetical protein